MVKSAVSACCGWYIPAKKRLAERVNWLAENAVQEKDGVKAIAEYTAALTIYPTWPEGQFNLALLCRNTGDYNAAVEHMQAYLELMPDAPDARARERQTHYLVRQTWQVTAQRQVTAKPQS